jgi:hypothetical protein
MQDLFNAETPPKAIRDWRAVPLDPLPEDKHGLAALADRLVALSRRSRAFLRALSLKGVSLGASDREPFDGAEVLFVGNLALLRQRRVKPLEVPAVLAIARKADRDLTAHRRAILAALAPDVCRQVLAAEPRVRIHEFEIEHDAAALDFSWADKLQGSDDVALDKWD